MRQVTAKGSQLLLEAPKALIKGDVVATSYGWSVFAMISTYVASHSACAVCNACSCSSTLLSDSRRFFSMCFAFSYTVDEVAGGGGGIPVLPWNRTIAA